MSSDSSARCKKPKPAVGVTAACLLAAAIVACHQSDSGQSSVQPAGAAASPGQATTVATGMPAIANTPVGPLPGSAEAVHPDAVNPFAGSEEAVLYGRRYFLAYNCAGCHGDHGGGGMGPSLRDDIWLYGNSHGQIANSIALGRAQGMPAWGVMLTPEQIWQITAYIKSLRTDREPQPPAVTRP